MLRIRKGFAKTYPLTGEYKVSQHICVNGSALILGNLDSIPDILLENKDSFAIVDPNGKLYLSLKDKLHKQGKSVKVLNFANPNGNTRHYNPLWYVKSLEDAETLASCLLGGENDPAKKLFYTAAISHVCSGYLSQRKVSNLIKVINNPSVLENAKGNVGKIYRKYTKRRTSETQIEPIINSPIYEFNDLFLTELENTALFIITKQDDFNYMPVIAHLYTQLLKRKNMRLYITDGIDFVPGLSQDSRVTFYYDSICQFMHPIPKSVVYTGSDNENVRTRIRTYNTKKWILDDEVIEKVNDLEAKECIILSDQPYLDVQLGGGICDKK